MPFPTAQVGDPIVYKDSAGVHVPGFAASADGGSGVISVFVDDDAAGAYFVPVVPKDLAGAQFNSWNWPVGASGGVAVTLTAVGSTPSANAASLSGQALTLQPADAAHPGVVSTAAQAFGGVKTIADGVKAATFAAVGVAAAVQGIDVSTGNTYVRAPGGGLVNLGVNGTDQLSIGGASINSTTAIEITVVGQSFVLKSPDGTRWKLAVADTTGVLTAVLA